MWSACIIRDAELRPSSSGGSTASTTSQGGSGGVSAGGGGSGGASNLCGNGFLDGSEVCDDGNANADDGCSSVCEPEDGWECDGAEPTDCAEICGDGMTVGAEACDDGYTDDCGSCNADCSAPGEGSECGDGVICPETEECDDESLDDGDGCSAECGIEPGWSCDGEPSTCQEGCGDGEVVGIEECDDGALDDDDGCSSSCEVEDGWSCDNTSPPSSCAEICGDHLVVGVESCDDGGTDACGPCNADCSAAGTGSTCGDGTVCPDTESCDDGHQTACGSCNADCTAAGTGSTCGDGILCPDTEFCDDDGTDPCGPCNADCTAAGTGSTCGDGILCPDTEFCDDDNQTACGACNADCSAAGTGYCGDGQVCPDDEVCDGPPQACTTSCNSTGSEDCVSCDWSGTCTPPVESCNNADDDCVDGIDNGFDCPQSQTMTCSVGGCDGTRDCSASCTWLGDCAPPWEAPAPPVPKQPQNGFRTGSHLVAASLAPTFTWMASSADCGAVSYDLQVDDSCATPGFAACSFPSPEVDASGLAATDYEVPNALPTDGAAPYGRRYYWRVRACDVFDRCGDWSPVRYVDVGRAPNDFNGDGYSDLLVAAQDYNVQTGRAYLFLGGASFDTTADLVITGESQHGAFTNGMSGVGDVDADGFADFVIGAEGIDKTYLFHGREDLTATANLSATDRDLEFTGVDTLGYWLVSPGDVDADGFADVLLGAQNDGSGRGRADLYFGGDPMNNVSDWNAVGPTTATHLGWVTRTGDVDVDGYLDFGVGEVWHDATVTGCANVFLGGPTASYAVEWSLCGSAANDRRFAANGVLDLNGDGFSDVAVANPGQSKVDLFWGGPAVNLESAADVTLSGISGTDFGGGYSPGDVNGDGHDDLLLAGPLETDGGNTAAGAAYLYYGNISSSSTPALRMAGLHANDNLGAGPRIGDLNSDGYPEVAMPAFNGDATTGTDAGYLLLVFGASDMAASWAAPVTLEGEVATNRFGRPAEAPP